MERWYRGNQMEKKKIITENQEKRCRMIGIAGSNTGVGCTHFSIMLTNYLAGYLRRKAILLEFNESGDLEKLEYVCTGQMGQKNPYRVLDADYYKYAGPEAVKEVLQRGYDDILIDLDRSKMAQTNYIGDAIKSSWRVPLRSGSRRVSGNSRWNRERNRKKAGRVSRYLEARRPEENSREDFGSMQNGFRFQRMPSRSRRSAGNFFSVSCKNDIKGRFP